MIPVSPPPPKARLRRYVRRALWALLIVFVLLAGFICWVYFACLAKPPELPQRPAILDVRVAVEAGGRRSIGKSWYLPRQGESLLYLEGDPFTLGYCNAALTSEYMEAQERSLMETVRSFLPSPFTFYAVAAAVIVNNRNLNTYVKNEYQFEIFGLASGSSDPFPQYGPRYNRILNYHAAHDISHWVWDTPAIGCTAFAAKGSKTVDGNLIVARSFDWESGRHFDENKIIGLYRPSSGHAFLSVSWPGMTGVVTGLNDARLYCSVNGAHSQDRNNIGIPVSLVVREVLQYTDSIAAAVEMIRAAPVFVSDSYLIADGKTGEAVVVEKSPARTEVRRMEGELLFQANHFESLGFDQDTGNTDYKKRGSSLSRRTRLEELLKERTVPIDAPAAVSILRDRRGPAGFDLAPGNRGAINAMIGTHAVVADLTHGILWVSRGPHSLGRFSAHSINSFGADLERDSIPDDSSIADGTYASVEKARANLSKARQSSNFAALELLSEALAAVPGDADVHLERARIFSKLGKRAEAAAEYQKTLEAHPPFLETRDEAKEALLRLRK